MKQLRFILRKGFTLHVSGNNPTHHQEYMCCNNNNNNNIVITAALVNLQYACLPVAIYSTCTPDDGWDCHPKHVE